MSGKIIEPSAAYEAQRALIKLPRTLMGGTAAMRDAGEEYLPKKTAETREDYDQRLASAVLVNYFARTVDYLAGQVFQKPVEYQPPAEDEQITYSQDFFLNTFAENVDLTGNNLSNFCLKLFKDGIIDGVSFILVDYPHVSAERDAGGAPYIRQEAEDGVSVLIPKTAEVDRRNGWRPYFVSINVNQVLDAWMEVKDGRAVLSMFAYEEFIEQPEDGDDAEREIIQRIRILRPGSWELWESREITGEDGTAKKHIEQIGSGSTTLDYIPVFWFMPGADRNEAITADPPLADLAEMNRAYWVAYSNHRELMKWNSSPILFGVNIVDGQGAPLAIGPSKMVVVKTGQDTSIPPSIQSIGVNPASVAASREDLTDMRNFMESYGLQIALASAGNVTATMINTVNNSTDSQLKGWCVKFADTIENALKAVSQYESGRLDVYGPAILVNMVFRQSYDQAQVAMLLAMVNASPPLLTPLTYLRIMKQIGALPDEFDPDVEAEQLEKEREALMPSLSNIFPPGGGQLPRDGTQRNQPPEV